MIDGVFRRNFKLQNLKFRNGILHFRMSPLYLLVHLLVSILFFQMFHVPFMMHCMLSSNLFLWWPTIWELFPCRTQIGNQLSAVTEIFRGSIERTGILFFFFLIFGWCFSLFFLLYLSMTSMFVVSSADTHVFLLTVGKGKEKRSSLYCHICKKRAGDSWAEGNDLFFPFSFLMWIFCRLLEFKVTF